MGRLWDSLDPAVAAPLTTGLAAGFLDAVDEVSYASGALVFDVVFRKHGWPGVRRLLQETRSEKTMFSALEEMLDITSNPRGVVAARSTFGVNAFPMGGIARDAGLTVDEFRKLL